MSASEISSLGKFRYQRLRFKSEEFDDENEIIRERVAVRPKKKKKWYRIGRIPIRKRFRFLKVASLRRLWRKKAKVVSARMRKSCAKVMTRLKEGHVHFGDLFAGNYLFMQVSPTSLKYLQKQISLSKIA